MKYLPVEMPDITLVISSLFEAAGDGEDHHGVAVEGDVQAERVEVMLRLGQLVKERNNTEFSLFQKVMSLFLIVNSQQISTLGDVG